MILKYERLDERLNCNAYNNRLKRLILVLVFDLLQLNQDTLSVFRLLVAQESEIFDDKFTSKVRSVTLFTTFL